MSESVSRPIDRRGQHLRDDATTAWPPERSNQHSTSKNHSTWYLVPGTGTLVPAS